MRSTTRVRSTIHTTAVLLSNTQYMDMHQHLHNTPPQWKLQWTVNQKKRLDDYVNTKQPVYLPTTDIQTNVTFYAYIHQCAIDILDNSFNQCWCKAKPWHLKSNTKQTTLNFRKRKLNHTETDKRTQNANNDVDEVKSSWSLVNVVEDDDCFVPTSASWRSVNM